MQLGRIVLCYRDKSSAAGRKRTSLKIEYGYDAERMEQYLREYIADHNMEQSEIALDIAIRMHRNQRRAEGIPYIVHPMMLVSHAIAMGQNDDNLIAVMLLHDVCEDCPVEPEELPVNETVRHGVRCMTNVRQKGESKADSMERYLEQIRRSKEACLTKLYDRCNNISSMAGAFSGKKLVSYIDETRTHIYPLMEYVKTAYPEYAEAVFLLEYHMTSVINSLEYITTSCES